MKKIYEKGLSYEVRRTYLKGILLAFFLLGLSSAKMQAQIWTINYCSGLPSVTQSSAYGPMYSTASANATNRLATIYPASQLAGIANQVLTGVYFHTGAGNSNGMLGTPSFKVWLKEVSQDDWGTGALDWATASAGATLLFDGNPAPIVGTTGGWKEFPFTGTFTYSGTQNLALFVEYTNPSASNAVSWSYEYNSTCTVAAANGTKYSNNTSGTLPSSLTTSNLRRPYIGFDMVVSCPAPQNVTVNGITQTGATMTWTAGGTETSWDYAIQPAGTGIPGTWTTTTSTTLSPTLSSGTQYEFYVRANCGGSDGESIWKGPYEFSTLCAPFAVPYSQNFDTTSVGTSTNNNAPHCWTYYETPGSTGYGYVSSSAANVVSAPHAYYLYRASTTTGHLMLISPETPTLSNGANRVRFSAKATVAGKELAVGTMTDPTDPATFTVLQTISLTTTHTVYDVNFPAGTAAYLAFNNATSGSASAIYIDDIFVEPMPSCYPPESPAFGTITADTVAMNWSAPLLGNTASSYTVYYSTTNTAPDATTVLDATNSVTATGTSGTITGLTSNTEYFVWMRSTCAAPDVSHWLSVGSVTTACAPVATLFEDFESYSTGSIVPNCWARILPPTGMTAGSQTISSSGAIGSRNIYQYTSTANASVIVALPEFSNVNAGTHWLKLKARTTSAPGALEVGYVTDITDWNSFVNLQTLDIVSNSYVNGDYSVVIPSWIPSNARIAIKSPSDAKSYYWDDVIWEPIPSCLPPATLLVDATTASSVTLSWMASTSAPANGYDVYFSTSNMPPDATTVPQVTGIMTPNTTISTGIQPATTYYVWVRSTCSSSDMSDWIGGIEFTTACATMTAPFYQSFNSGDIPPCWTSQNPTTTSTSTAAFWKFSGAPGYGATPANNGKAAGEFAWVDASAPYDGEHQVQLLSPLIDLTGVANPFVRFEWFKNHSSSTSGAASTYDDNKLTVDVFNGTTWSTIFSSMTNDPSWREVGISLGAAYSGTTIQLRFTVDKNTGSNPYFYDDLLLDEVYVMETPTCLKPTDVMITGATLNPASLDVTWTAPVGSPTPVQSYEYYVSSNNTPPTAATPATGTSATTSVTINTGLLPETQYYVWVRSVCSATDKSEWSAVAEGITGYCIPTQTGTSTTYYLAEATTTGAVTELNYTATSHQSYVNSATVFSGYSTQTFDISLDGSGTLTYNYYIWVDWNNDLDFDDPNEVMLATTTKVASYNGPFTIPGGVPLGMYKMRIGAAYSGIPADACGSLTSGNFVDLTLNVVAPPSCVAPSNIQISNIGYNTATVSWDASVTPPAMGYDVYYSTSNTPPTAATVPLVTNVAGLSTPISGLQPQTKYYVWVRSHCAASDQSAWSAIVVDFTTECQPPAITGTTSSTSSTPMCMYDTATLTATADAGATINWYDVPTGGTAVGTGASFTTPPLAASTQYYVAASTGTNYAVGPVNPNSLSGGATTTAITTYYIEFEVSNIPLTLISTDVFPAAAGQSSTLEILEGPGTFTPIHTINFTSTIASDGTIAQTVPINVVLDPGVYRMRMAGGSYYRIYQSNATFPYTAPNFSIYNGSNISSNSYYFMYNLMIGNQCESARTPVAVDVNTACSLSTSEISKDDQSVRVYPNPFTDVINISEAKNLKSVTVMDASGRMVKTIANPGAQIHLGELKSGLYLLNLRYADGNTTTVKVIKR